VCCASGNVFALSADGAQTEKGAKLMEWAVAAGQGRRLKKCI